MAPAEKGGFKQCGRPLGFVGETDASKCRAHRFPSGSLLLVQMAVLVPCALHSWPCHLIPISSWQAAPSVLETWEHSQREVADSAVRSDGSGSGWNQSRAFGRGSWQN